MIALINMIRVDGNMDVVIMQLYVIFLFSIFSPRL